MATPPMLIGPRVRLRAPRVEDADALYEAVASDPEVTRYLSWRPHPDVEETRRVLTEVFNSSDDPTWVVELRVSGQVIGTCAWERPRPHAVEAERDPSVFRISAYCHVDNSGSAGVLRRCGLDLEGRLGRYVVFPNLVAEPQDCFMFAKAVR